MSSYVVIMILGLTLGAVYAALAMGIVVTYQGAGVVNFAASSLAAVPLYVVNELGSGRLTLPVPFMPSYEVMRPPTWLSVLVGLAVAGALGLVVDTIISRPLRNAPALAKVAAAVGLLVTVQTGLGLKYGTAVRPLQPLFPTGTVEMLGVTAPLDRVCFLILVVLAGVALALWFGRSSTGLAIQAAAENERAASFAGLSPLALGRVTWIVATMFISFMMMMAGPALGSLTPATMTLLVVPALAAALIARLRSVWGALAGGLVMGAIAAELQFVATTKTWWPDWAKQGLTDALPFLVTVLVLFLVGRSIPLRGEEVTQSLPPVRLPQNRPVVLCVLFGFGLAALGLTSGLYRFAVITSIGSALIMLSLVVLTGFVGQVSLAQAGFAGVAGLSLSLIGRDLPFPITMVLAVCFSTVAGVLVALPALRIRGVQLAIVTLAAAVTLERFVIANPQILSPSANLIPNPSFLGIDLSIQTGQNVARLGFGVFVLTVVTAAFLLVGNVLRAGSGRKMLAVRSNERAASSVGVSVSAVKLAAFAMASALAGLGGCIIGYSRGQLSPESFGTMMGLNFLAISYVGGISSVSGALAAGAMAPLGIVFVVLDHSGVGQYYTLFSGVLLIATVILNPEGVAGKNRQIYDLVVSKLKRSESKARPLDIGPIRAEHAVNGTREGIKRAIGDAALRTEGITVTYGGGMRAVDNLSITVRAGEIVGLIGPNGAGKTSFIDAVTGFTPSVGRVFLGEHDISGVAPHSRARAGLARTWQAVDLFDDLSAEANVRLGSDTGRDFGKMMVDAFRPNRGAAASVDEALRTVGLEAVRDRRPSELPLGHQKLLGVARCLALKPKVLLLDEPAAGLDSSESLAFGERLEEIAASGVGCLLVDHDMHLVLGVCDRIYVINFGEQIANGSPAQVRKDPAVVAAYLGVTDASSIAENV